MSKIDVYNSSEEIFMVDTQVSTKHCNVNFKRHASRTVLYLFVLPMIRHSFSFKIRLLYLSFPFD